MNCSSSLFNLKKLKLLSVLWIQHQGPDPHLLQHRPQSLLLGDDQLPLTKSPPFSLPFSHQLGLHWQKTVLAVQRLRVEHSRVVELYSKLVQEKLDPEQQLENM